jgi:hypothetical protein
VNQIHDPQGARYEPAEPPAYAESDDDYREPIEQPSLSTERGAHKDPYDLSLFQSLREKEYTSDLEYDQSPSVRYRRYIAVVVAALIMALGYVAWRNSRTNQNAQGVPLAPSPAVTDTAPASANQNTAASAPGNPPDATEPQASPATSNAVPPAVPRPAEKPKQVEAAAKLQPTTPPPNHSSSSPQPASETFAEQSSQGNGAEELAMAQRYLGGSSGQARDAAEAAKWLWKSIAKHNGPAVLVLADLYLKGDGVSKSCDQARVLLDSAARRGMAGAGQRLRNIQAFGCQ